MLISPAFWPYFEVRLPCGDVEAQRLCELLQRVDLDLDFDHVASRRPCALDCCPDAARDRDVVVLDENAVVEAEAMVRPAWNLSKSAGQTRPCCRAHPKHAPPRG